MRPRIALVITSRLRAEARRERFARFRRREWLRRPYRSYSLFVALRDGALGNTAGLGVEAIQIALDPRRYSGSCRSRRGWNAVEPLEALGCNLLRGPLI